MGLISRTRGQIYRKFPDEEVSEGVETTGVSAHCRDYLSAPRHCHHHSTNCFFSAFLPLFFFVRSLPDINNSYLLNRNLLFFQNRGNLWFAELAFLDKCSFHDLFYFNRGEKFKTEGIPWLPEEKPTDRVPRGLNNQTINFNSFRCWLSASKSYVNFIFPRLPRS